MPGDAPCGFEAFRDAISMAQPSAFIVALTEAIVPAAEPDVPQREREAVLAKTAAFVQGQVDALPRRLSLMFAAGTLVFRFYVRLTHFRSFCGLDAETRRRVVEQWAYGRVALFRALFKLVRSTALLVFYESPEVRAALDRAQGATTAGSGR